MASEVVDAKDNYVVVVEQEELQNKEEQVVQMDLNFATELNLVLKCKMADYEERRRLQEKKHHFLVLS